MCGPSNLPGISFPGRPPQGGAIWSNLSGVGARPTKSQREVNNKGHSHKGAAAGGGERHHDEKAATSFGLRLTVQGIASLQRLGRQFNLSEDDFGGAV